MSDITMYQGNNKNWIITVKDEDGVVVDISTAKLTFSVKEAESDAAVLFERLNTAAGGGDTEIAFVTDGSDGQAIIKLIPANTTSLANNYVYDVEMELSGRTLTVVKGVLTILKKVT